MIPHETVPCDAPLVREPAPFALVLFGATGDLARRKLLPAVYSLSAQGLLSLPFAVVAFARREGDDNSFRAGVRESISRFAPDLPTEGPTWERFAASLHYHRSELDDEGGYVAFRERLEQMDGRMGLGGNRLFYLAVPPEHFEGVVQHLGSAGLVHAHTEDPGAPWTRVVVEKPFGYDLESARALNSCLRHVFAEPQVFRIDHYLGKETVQNILVMRFANRLYELLWNQAVIDNVQITVAETLGMEGRGAYFDAAGITRDVIQNHALQVLTLIAMEPPVSLDADAIRNEKVKVLQSMRPFTAADVRRRTVRGQYTAARTRLRSAEEPEATGYTHEDGVQPHSTTDTFAAIRFQVDNWRWAGVPFYVRAGKRLPFRATEVTIELKAVPDVLFTRLECAHIDPNRLTLRIQPNEGITLRMSAKVPGPRVRVEPVDMNFGYAEQFKAPIPDAYERLVLDAILGEAALFARVDEVEAAWEIITPILRAWEADSTLPDPYTAGTWGPPSADALLRAEGREWHNPEV